jgi:hypothetical protein
MPNELKKEAAREAKYGEKMIEVKVRFWVPGDFKVQLYQPKYTK